MELTGAIIIGAVLGTAFIVFVIYAIVKGQKLKLSAGAEVMVGQEAVAQTAINPKGTVLAEGELWTAVSQGSTIEPGEEVVITRVKGLKLWVARKTEEKEEA